MNLLDNSIYWLANKSASEKTIYISATNDLDGTPAIVVADSGPGFSDPPEMLVQPFISRRPDGMGLGLHLANEVAKLHKGQLDFPSSFDLELPESINGAIVALKFTGK